MLDRRRHRPLRAPGADELGHPEPAQLALEVLHRVADIGGILGLAADVDEDRQVAAEADRVEMREEEEAVGAADEILDVVLRGGEEDVDACLVEQRVQMAAVEGERESRAAGCLFVASVHDTLPRDFDFPPIIAPPCRAVAGAKRATLRLRETA